MLAVFGVFKDPKELTSFKTMNSMQVIIPKTTEGVEDYEN